MTKGQHTEMGRALALAAGVLCLVASGCEQPSVGARSGAPAPTEGPRIAIDDATVDLHGHVVVTFSASEEGLPLALAEVTALAPRFTLATLGVHPLDGFPAWKSELLTGSAISSLPLSSPATPEVLPLSNVKQPGSESSGQLVGLGGGRFRYVFANALVGLDADATVRVGMYLRAAPSPSLRTSATHDFRPSGGPLDERETVRDENCAQCHGAAVVAHDGRAGVRLCETCHTWQNADPDTVDPAALHTTVVPARTDPNPLELGRLVHRLHRGKRLPTLFQASSSANPAPALAAGNDLPLPFSAENNVAPIFGRKYSIVGYQASELVGGQVVQRASNGQPAKTMAVGITYPRELRDCAACHGGARQGYLIGTAISRRTCAGCHPDTWYQATPAQLDGAHFAHPGREQADDSRCADCHVKAPPGGKLYAPIAQLHVPITEGDRYADPKVEILEVSGVVPNGRPVVRFRVTDRRGPVIPTLAAPTPLWEPDSATSSLVWRKFSSFSIRVAGPTAPDYGPASSYLLSSGAAGGNVDPLTAMSTATDEYVYTFSSTLPSDATGTWAIGFDGRRQLKYGHYDKGTDTFRWPGTGETVRDSPDNAIAFVNTASGGWLASASPQSPGAEPRRKVVAEQNCLRCHGRFELHGGQRHQLEFCLFCHTPTATDWAQRPKVSGKVNLAATWDGIEERSIHLKVMVHRIHTGGRRDAASLEAIEPFVVMGYGGNPYFFDEGLFPDDLANCTACHSGKTFRAESVPAGAPATIANETATVRHAASTLAHPASEAGTPPVQAACLGCHATGASIAHAADKTVNGVETCAQCHAKGARDVEVAHGLAPLTTTAATASFASIVQNVLVPRCASAACHGPGATPPTLDAAAAYGALVGVTSGQASPRLLVEPNAPERSYLVDKLRGTAGVGQIMPIDGAIAPADLAAIEAWISNGAPND